MKPIHLDPQQRQELQRRRRQTHDKRLYERLSAVLWVADGKTRFEVADLLGRSVRQLAEWLRLFRNRGLEALCTLHHQGDPGNLSAGQVERLKEEISTGRFRNSDQIRLLGGRDIRGAATRAVASRTCSAASAPAITR